MGWTKICYGVDVRGHRISIVRAVRGGRRVACGSADDAARMRAELASGDAVAAACMSPRDSLTRRIDAPFTSRRKSIRVLPTLLDIKLPFAIEQCRYVFLDFHRTVRKTMQTLAVVATEEAIETKLRALAAAGVDPVVLDQEGLAVWTQLARDEAAAGSSSDARKIVLIMEEGESTLVIGDGVEFVNAYAVRLDDLPRMVRLVRAQSGGEERRTTWFLAGAGALDPAAVACVRELLAREQLGTGEVVDRPESFVARALAERTLTAGPLRCNLRTGRLAHPALVRHARAHLTRAMAMVLAAGLLLCGVNVAVRVHVGRMKKRTLDSTAAFVDRLAGYHVAAKGSDAMGIVAGRVEERKEELSPFAHAFDPSLVDVIGGIVTTAGRNRLTCDTIALSRRRAEVSGVASEWNAVESVAAVLTQAGYDVNIERKESLADESVPFTIVSRDGR